MNNKSSRQKIGIIPKLGIATSLGVFSGATISPAIAMVDRAIIENLSGVNTQSKSLKNSATELLRNPFRFVQTRKEIRWVFFVYGPTYTTANTVEIMCKEKGIPVAAPKFMLVSTINIMTTVIKDRFLARMFGATKPKPVPTKSFLLWAFRDSMTIMFSFIVPPKLTRLAVNAGYSKKRCEVGFQMACPVFL